MPRPLHGIIITETSQDTIPPCSKIYTFQFVLLKDEHANILIFSFLWVIWKINK